MYGNSANGAHAYNWYPTQDFSSIVIFEPQNGQAQATSAYKAYFGIY
jgi:hypothetical protein